MERGYPKKVVNILLSEQAEWFIELTSQLVHNTAKLSISVVALTPNTIYENDLFNTATRYNWEFAVLFLNNISYSSGDRKNIANDSIEFVRKVANLFGRPIIAVHGLTEGPWYHAQLLEVGATAVFRVPFEIDDMEQAIKRCSNIW